MPKRPCSAQRCKNDATICVLRLDSGQPIQLAFCIEHIDHLGKGYVLPKPKEEFRPLWLSSSFRECHLERILFTYDRDDYVVVLSHYDSSSVFVFPTGYIEGCSIWNIAANSPRPGIITHELITHIVRALGGSVLEAVLHGYDEATQRYDCYLTITSGNEHIDVPCRISDAVAVSLLAEVPIKINESFLGEVEV